MQVDHLDDADALVTLDGCTIREPARAEPLRLLCCCAPPYSHDDIVLTGG